MTPMTLDEVIEKRRDTRHFLPDEVPDAVLLKALQAAHKAPSVGLSEAVKFYLVRKPPVKKAIYNFFKAANDKIIEQLARQTNVQQRYQSLKLEGILESALGMVVTTDYSVLKNFTIGVAGTADTLQWSSVCAVQNLWLSLTEQGYSLGWVSILDYQNLKNLLRLPAHEFPLGYFCIGKAASDYQQQPMLQLKKWKQKKTAPFVKEIATAFFKEERKKQYSIIEDQVKVTTETNEALHQLLLTKINNKTKPVGALGQLEKIALHVGKIQNTIIPVITKPHIVVFAADHGISATGLVNPYPQGVTAQMVKNFLAGGAAINVFCRQYTIRLKIVDAGVNTVWEDALYQPDFIVEKIGFGTRNYLEEPAMTETEAIASIEKGKEIVQNIFNAGCNCIGLGEMGIGNTSSAALIMSAVTCIPIAACAGRGTGANDEQLKTKIEVLEKVAAFHQLKGVVADPIKLLARVGGFEIAMMAGAYLKATELKMIIVTDGFISTASLLIAQLINQNVIKYCVFSHTSGEQGHEKMLAWLKVKPLLQLGMRLGEGTGAALAIPLIQSAVNFLNEMASFESAGVSNKE